MSYKKLKIHISLFSLMLMMVIGCTSFDYLTKVEQSFPDAHQCGKCHIDIYHEWQNSAHAEAFSNNEYKLATNNYQFTECLGCHAPSPTLTDARPEARIILRQEGVTCVSCHLEEGQMQGPLDPTGAVVPHPVNVDAEQYKNSAFCGRCHEGTYQQWQASSTSNTPTCQHCHMPSIHRKMTQSKDFMSKIIVSFEEEEEQKQHLFTCDPNLINEPIINVSTNVTNSQVTLNLTNQLPHSLPTGDFGVRTVTLKISSINKSGSINQIKTEEWIKELKTDLQPGQSRSYTIDRPEDCQTVAINIIHYDRDMTNPIELFSHEVPLK